MRFKNHKDTLMRIALDYTAGIRQGAGVGQYVRSLVDAMLAQDARNEYTFITSGRPTLAGKARKVVTVYDLAFLQHPETAVPSLAAYLKKVVPESVAQADVVAAISHATKQALIEHYRTPQEKITVIPCGIAPHFQRITDPALLEATRRKFDLKGPLVLSVGTLEPRKNHLGLIKAFYEVQQSKENSAILAIAGGKGW